MWAAHLPPLPADLVLVLLDTHIGVHTLTADQLEASIAAIRLANFHLVKYAEVFARVPARRSMTRAITALALATAAYANAKFGIKADIDSLRDEAAFGKRLGQRIGELGDTCTLYGMLRRVIEVNKQGSAEALWFENKTWTYDQLKDCKLRL